MAGGIFHVYARGNDRRPIFVDNTDRRRYLSLLGRSTRQQEWNTLAYCLMPNHVHLLIETPRPNLAVGMHRVQSPYARLFNRRHDRTGHVFQSRYGAVRMNDDPQLVTVVRYIVRNPVEAGLASDPSGWRWSSHRAAAGIEDPPPWLALNRLHALLAGWSGGDSAYRDLTAT